MSKKDEKPDKPITNEPNQDATDAESTRRLREQLNAHRQVSSAQGQETDDE